MEFIELFFAHYFAGWNVILLVIAACSVVAVAIFIERLITLKRSEINANAFLIDLRKHIEQQNMVEAMRLCDNTGGAIGNIIKVGLGKHDRGKQEMEASIEVAGMTEVARLEKNAKILSVIAHITPLIGLLGTVLGFIEAFTEMRQSGLMDISTTRIGEAMEYALVTTAAGLAVAIPTVIGYNYIVSRIKGIVLEMHTTASEVVDIVTHDAYEI